MIFFCFLNTFPSFHSTFAVTCRMELFYVIARLRRRYNVVFVLNFIRHCEASQSLQCSLCVELYTSLRGFAEAVAIFKTKWNG